MLKIILFLTAVAGFVYVGLVAFAFLIQRKFIYMPTHRDSRGSGSSLFKPWRDSTESFLGYAYSPEKAERVLLFFHGNAGEALDREWVSELVEGTRVAVVLAEYPGYGAKPGAPSEAALFQAAEHILSEVTRRWPNTPVTLLGESLGSAVACFLSNRPEVERVALLAPFTSAIEIGKRAYPFLPIKLLLQDKFESLRYVSTLSKPLHILHGTLDEVVPLSQGQVLFKAAKSDVKSMTEIPGYGHANLAAAATDSPFADKFRSFLIDR